MTDPTRIGLVGIGGYGQRHLNTLSTLHSAAACRLMAIADPFSERFPETIAALHTLDVQVHDSLDTLLQSDVEAVVIATPIPLHVPQTLAALQAGKHVYLEKPPCTTLEELTQLAAAQKQSQTTCAVGFQLQSTAALRFLKKQLANGAIGKLQAIWSSVRWMRTDEYYGRSSWAGRWRHDGQPVFDGPATNALSHVVHAALFLANAENIGLARVRGMLKKARPIESYDAAFLEAETTQNVSVRLAFTHATKVQEEVVLRCTGQEGEAELGWNGRVVITRRGTEPQRFYFASEPHIAVMLDFLRAIHDPRHQPFTTLCDCLPYLQVTSGALQSTLVATGNAATEFDQATVRQIGHGKNGAHFTVSGLDDEMATFASHFDRTPALLTPGDWIETGQIQTVLTA